MVSWEQHAEMEELANESRAIQELAEIIDEHYYTLVSTPEVALDGFIYDIDFDNPDNSCTYRANSISKICQDSVGNSRRQTAKPKV